MRGATGVTKKKETPIKISIHAPHAGSDCKQSKEMLLQRYFNPRSPCGERRLRPRRSCRADDFNPRSPCGERLNRKQKQGLPLVFQSTLPMRGATINVSAPACPLPISIHAPHAGSDRCRLCWVLKRLYFNPRSPCGERPKPT